VENKSEVAQLMREIDERYQSAQQALSGPAIVSRHDFIAARTEGIARCHEQLEQLVGQQQAMELLITMETETKKGKSKKKRKGKKESDGR